MDTMQPRDVSIVEPIGTAIEKTKDILFRPFDLTKWFAIGFCAWLATLGDGGGGGGGHGNFHTGNSSSGGGNFQHEVHNLKEAFFAHLPVIISIGIVVALVIIVLSLVFIWLRSRGQFMFLHCVAQNKGEVVYPWKRYSQQANSLFLFKAILWGIGAVLSLGLVIPLVLIVLSFAETDFKVFAAAGVIPAILIVLAFILMGITFTVVKTLTVDFVVPIMYLDGCGVADGWRRFWALCKANMGTFFLFLLFLIVVNIALGFIVLAVVVAACCMCCVGVIFMIPYIGTVAMLPLLVWRRAYSALFLAQFGPQFDVFMPASGSVVVPSEAIVPVESDGPIGPVTEGGDLPPEPPQGF